MQTESIAKHLALIAVLMERNNISYPAYIFNMDELVFLCVE